MVRPDGTRCDPVTFGYAMLAVEAQIARLGEGSTGQTELSRAQLQSFMVDLPEMAQSVAVAPALELLDDYAEALRTESKRLSALRDALLLPLLSGTLRVREATSLLQGEL